MAEMKKQRKAPIEIERAYVVGVKADLVKREVRITLSVSFSPEVLDLRTRLAEVVDAEIPCDLVLYPTQLRLDLPEPAEHS